MVDFARRMKENRATTLAAKPISPPSNRVFIPSPEQAAVIKFATESGESLNVGARAGTGKTTTLVEVVRVLRGLTWVCAFNKPIADELEYKIFQVGGISDSDVNVSTVHSGGMRAWGKHCNPTRPRVEKRKVWQIIDALGDPILAADRFQTTANELYIKRGGLIEKLVGLAKTSGFGVPGLPRYTNEDNWLELIEHFSLDTDADVDNDKQWYDIISAAIVVYKKSLDRCNREIDFSDMLLAPVLNKVQMPKYDNILIDEAQDISPLRLKLILSCLKTGGRVIAVGDVHQAIYGFAGADSESMKTIRDITNAHELPLTVTRRCPRSVVELANQWVPDFQAHEDAPEGTICECWLKDEKAKTDDDTLAAKANDSFPVFWEFVPFTADDAVICRNTKPIVSLAYDLLRKQIPCLVEGRDIGQSLITLAQKFKTDDLVTLSIQLDQWKTMELDKLNAKKQSYKAQDLEDKCDTLVVLIEATENSGGKSTYDLINLVNRLFGDTQPGERPKCITLSTVHKSKGREWKRVFILGRNQFMPSKYARQAWEKEQEINLMYVAVTRTKDMLIDVHVPEKKKG